MFQKRVNSAYITFLGGKQQVKSRLILCQTSYLLPAYTKELAHDDAPGNSEHPQPPIRRPGAPWRDAASGEKAAISGPGRSAPRPAACGRRHQTQPGANPAGPPRAARSHYRSCLPRTGQLTKQQSHEDRQRLPLSPCLPQSTHNSAVTSTSGWRPTAYSKSWELRERFKHCFLAFLNKLYFSKTYRSSWWGKAFFFSCSLSFLKQKIFVHPTSNKQLH